MFCGPDSRVALFLARYRGPGRALQARRVRETTAQAWRRPGPERWFLIERHCDGRYKYYLSNAPAARLSVPCSTGPITGGRLSKVTNNSKRNWGSSILQAVPGAACITISLCAFGPMAFCNCCGRENKAAWPLPTARRWLNRLLRFTQCPHCRGYHVAVHLPLFSSA
jgi:hypothetical protein